MTRNAKLNPAGLAAGYKAEFDRLNEDDWHAQLAEFADAHLYQSWACAAELGGKRTLLRMVLKRHGQVAAMSIARIRAIPFLRVGMASVYWGPVWRRRGVEPDPENFRQAVRALHSELVLTRGLILRVFPFTLLGDVEGLPDILLQEGFDATADDTRKLRIRMDLNPSLEALRAGMSAHARRNLRTAERNGLRVVEASSPDQFQLFDAMFRLTLDRKGLRLASDVTQFQRVHHRLPAELKPKLLLCYAGDTVCAGVIYSCMGEESLFHYSATTEEGVRNRSSYLLHWHAIVEAKNRGARSYDLDGVDPKGNPGTYRFKQGLAGLHGIEVATAGRFDAFPIATPYSALRKIENLRKAAKSLATRMNSSVRTEPQPTIREPQINSATPARMR